MKIFSCFFIVYIVVFINQIFAFNTSNNISRFLQKLQKQRTEQYVRFSLISNENTDSLKLINVNQLLETDNQILSHVVTLDSVLNIQNKKNSEAESTIALNKNILFYTEIIGFFFLCLFLAFFILFLVFRKKSIKNLKQKISKEKQFEELNSEHVSSMKFLESEMLLLQRNQVSFQEEIQNKNEKIANLEIRLKDYSQNEFSQRSSIDTYINEIEILQKQLHESENSIIKAEEKLNGILSETQNLNDQLNIFSEKNISLNNDWQEAVNEVSKLRVQITELQDNQNHRNIQFQTIYGEYQKINKANIEWVQKNQVLTDEKNELINDLKIQIEEKNILLNKITELERNYLELKSKIPQVEINHVKDLIEQNMEVLKLANLKLSSDNNQLEKVIRLREPEDVLVQKIKKLVDENYNLQLDLEEETAYSKKLNNKLNQYLDELEKQDLELELLNMKIIERTTPESRVKYDELDLNLVKIEKLNRLKEYKAITEEEYQQMKQNIITQI